MQFIILSIMSMFSSTYANISALIIAHYSLAIILLMTLESASLPIPSEVVLPIVGDLIARGILNPYIAYMAALVGTFIGITIDYLIAYLLGKEVIYKHLRLFHIKKESLDAFDSWFSRNGSFAVFVSRLLPIVRGLISLPAGFAQMSPKRFYLYSIAGAAIWNAALMAFGYYALSASNAQMLLASIAVLSIVLYLIYEAFLKRMMRS
ncbi:MAG: DedA family protein [Candidatus Marsarchaeota archaeon]|nr:DedA family protein [Candidatus Marsarchaeota archaeon]MCL5413022.1 DedA family protein [Candidatus Marsarchaeota archaeon]